MNNEKIVRLGKLEINLEELSEFLVEAKKNSWAGNGKRINGQDGSKNYVFKKDGFYYTDTYSGSIQALGVETVKLKNSNGPWIWVMNRFGGILPKYRENGFSETIHPFLKEALLEGSPKCLFRGPERYENRGLGLEYISLFEGDITRFNGKEKIIHKGMRHIVFSQDFIGGLVIPKS